MLDNILFYFPIIYNSWNFSPNRWIYIAFSNISSGFMFAFCIIYWNFRRLNIGFNGCWLKGSPRQLKNWKWTWKLWSKLKKKYFSFTSGMSYGLLICFFLGSFSLFHFWTDFRRKMYWKVYRWTWIGFTLLLFGMCFLVVMICFVLFLFLLVLKFKCQQIWWKPEWYFSFCDKY